MKWLINIFQGRYGNKGSSLILPIISLFLVTYFAVHLMHGARGLNVYFSLKDQIIEAESELEKHTSTLRKMDAKLARIGPHNIDRDLIDELARKNLGMTAKDEHVVFIGRPQKKIGNDTKSLILIPGTDSSDALN